MKPSTEVREACEKIWEAKGVKPTLHLPSPDELDAERAKETEQE